MKQRAEIMNTDPVLERLPSALVSALQISRHHRVRVPRGRSMISADHAPTSVFLISEGWAVSKLRIDTGDTQILDILGPGSFAGLSRIEEEINDGYAAVALQEVLAYRIDMARLRRVCNNDPDLGQWLKDKIAQVAVRSQRHVSALGQLPARGRLAFAMLRIMDIAEQMGQPAEHQTIRLPMTQEEIGNMLGLTNVSISKLMSAFRKEGLIDYGRNRITVHDVEALSEICGMSPENDYARDA